MQLLTTFYVHLQNKFKNHIHPLGMLTIKTKREDLQQAKECNYANFPTQLGKVKNLVACSAWFLSREAQEKPTAHRVNVDSQFNIMFSFNHFFNDVRNYYFAYLKGL